FKTRNCQTSLSSGKVESF
ncbi:hypothetical protein CISIN_1g0283872mg, partial [Citrus sinensis]